MSLASSDKRNPITFAADSTVTHFAGSTCGIEARFAGVSMVLGRMALSRTPSASTYCAATWISATAAAFDAA